MANRNNSVGHEVPSSLATQHPLPNRSTIRPRITDSITSSPELPLRGKQTNKIEQPETELWTPREARDCSSHCAIEVELVRSIVDMAMVGHNLRLRRD